MKQILLLVCCGLVATSAVHAQSPYWTGSEIAATADKIRTARIDDDRSGERKDRRGKDRDKDWLYIGPSVTVGVGSLDPLYGRYYGSYGGLTSRERRDEREACSDSSEGPARASSAIAAAPSVGDKEIARC